MNSYDFTPLFRHSIGFDRMQSLLNSLTRESETPQNSYPPYNIATSEDGSYRITLAVAGFNRTELDIEVREDSLSITGKVGSSKNSKLLHQGIAGRSFKRVFSLADYVKVKDASLENGLLHIDLIREIPESLKPRKIMINSVSDLSPTDEAEKLSLDKSKAAA
tara:strand:- start:4736 stop:5224 length:489 start_codon:yes stop_codon:yes gene_type:complete